MLSARVLMKQLAGFGIELSFGAFCSDFLGRSFAQAAERLKSQTGRDLPRDFAETYLVSLNELFAAELKPMANVDAVLESMAVGCCVVSGSIMPRIEFSLRVCGLGEFFRSNVYSTASVKNPKPAPDLFLHAAKVHQVAPSRCLALEDSEMGIRAAQAAGMTVWHFAGGSHVKAGYALPEGVTPDRVVHDMTELLRLFCEAGLCADKPVAGSVN